MDYQIQEIVTRILEGNATGDDRKILLNWINASDSNRKEFEQTESYWNALEILSNREKFNSSEGYDNFIRSLNKDTIIHPLQKQQNYFNYFLRIAASILLVLGISFLAYLITRNKIDTIAYFELTTPKGFHTQLTLTDGTKIWLNAGSKLRYPNKFNSSARTVYLEGEAYFNVKKDPKHPFIVQTSDVNVKALGTSFNVKAYPNEGSIETTLVSGIVVISGNKTDSKKEPIIELKPNQRATFIKTSGKLLLNGQEELRLKHTYTNPEPALRKKESLIVSKGIDTEIYTAWTENRLVFDNETFESIALKLERRYGATVLFKNEKIKKICFSGKFPEISIERALSALQYASPFNYEIEQDTIYIK
jgi:ferric-dicitrate binding protein FerR (iron transport regulator)